MQNAFLASLTPGINMFSVIVSHLTILKPKWIYTQDTLGLGWNLILSWSMMDFNPKFVQCYPIQSSAPSDHTVNYSFNNNVFTVTVIAQ